MKPNPLCYLEKGKALGAFNGFVATFNWLVNFCHHLKGEDGISVDTSDPENPVVRYTGKHVTKIIGSGDISVSPTDGTGEVTIGYTGSTTAGVTSISAGSGISVSPSSGTGDVTVSSTVDPGVTTINAGANVTVSSNTGAVTVSATDTKYYAGSDTNIVFTARSDGNYDVDVYYR